MKLEIETDIDLCNQILQQTGFKIQVIAELLPIDPSKIVGFNNDESVGLSFYDSDNNLIAYLNGHYRESDDTMPSTLIIYGKGEMTNLNWHPFGTMGGLDESEFLNQFKHILI